MASPVFYLLAGPNGAGKSTLYRALVASGTIRSTLEFVNADLYEWDHLQHITDPLQRSEPAHEWSDRRRAELDIRLERSVANWSTGRCGNRTTNHGENHDH